MAHNGQKFRFGPVRLLGRLLSPYNRLLFGNVAEHNHNTLPYTVIEQRGHPVFDEKA
ncbi:hypothetical protein D3C81_2201610 [compost metagenome]